LCWPWIISKKLSQAIQKLREKHFYDCPIYLEILQVIKGWLISNLYLVLCSYILQLFFPTNKYKSKSGGVWQEYCGYGCGYHDMLQMNKWTETHNNKIFNVCKIFHNCIHLQWSHFYKCLFNLVILLLSWKVMGHLHGIGNLKMFINVIIAPKATIATNLKTVTKSPCKCCFKSCE